MRPGNEPATSWFLVGFVSAVSQWGLSASYSKTAILLYYYLFKHISIMLQWLQETLNSTIWHIIHYCPLQIPFFFFFLPFPEHMEIPWPGMGPAPQQWPKPLQWQCQILNLLHHKRTPFSSFSLLPARQICHLFFHFC